MKGSCINEENKWIFPISWDNATVNTDFSAAGITTYPSQFWLKPSDLSSQSAKPSSRLGSDCPKWSRYSGIFWSKDRCFRGSEWILAPQRSFGFVIAAKIWPCGPISLIGIGSKQATPCVNISGGV